MPVKIKSWILEKGELKIEYEDILEVVEEYHPCDDSDGMICPYGVLVEQFPLEEKGIKPCKHYGHICPYHYVAELIV